jgi:hypothetical protein
MRESLSIVFIYCFLISFERISIGTLSLGISYYIMLELDSQSLTRYFLIFSWGLSFPFLNFDITNYTMSLEFSQDF